jgi:hypothetical protein
VQNVVSRDVYTNGGNQAFMIKSNGGSGYLRNVLLDNFQVRGTAYGLNVQQYWSGMTPVDGNGVQLNNITFSVCSIHVPSAIARINAALSHSYLPELEWQRRRRHPTSSRSILLRRWYPLHEHDHQ